MKRILLWIFSWRGLLVLLALLFTLIASSNFFTPTMAPDDPDQLFSETGGFEHIYLQTDKGQIHGVVAGQGDTMLVFIHGSPGSWYDFTSFAQQYNLDSHYRLLFVSRPGFGPSSHPHNGSLLDQAYWINHLAEREALSKNIEATFLFGHSYGGPVAVKLAVLNPSFVDGLVLAAPTISQPMQTPRWYNYVAAYPPVNWILGEWLINSNREMIMLHKSELRPMEEEWSIFNGPIIYIQGDKDVLVPASSLDYFKDRCSNCDLITITDSSMNHFIPWSHPQYLRQALDSLSDQDR